MIVGCVAIGLLVTALFDVGTALSALTVIILVALVHALVGGAVKSATGPSSGRKRPRRTVVAGLAIVGACLALATTFILDGELTVVVVLYFSLPIAFLLAWFFVQRSRNARGDP